jgi:outer membrane receptor protein involved in Fe transport
LANVTVASQETRIALSYSRIQTADFYQSDNTANGFNDNDRKFWRFAVDQDLDWFPNTRSKVILSYQQLVYDYTRHLAAPAALESVSQPASNEPFEAMVRFAGQSGHFTWSNDWTIDQNASAQWGVQFARKQETDAHLLGNFDLVQFNQQQFPINYYGEARKAFTIGLQDTQDNLGIYAQYLRNLRETTRLTLGGRYDEYPDIAGRFSPRLALVEQLSDTYSLKLLYGEAFRAPTLTEQGLTNSPVLVGNPSLTHEVVKTLDLILMGNWPTASFSIGLFQNRYQRPIETVFVFDKRTYMNGKVQRSQGVEVEWWQELSPHWSLRTSYTHMDLPDSAYREAERLASIQLNYSAAHWNWNLMGVYQDQRQNPLINGTRTTLDDFWVWNTEWRYDFSQAYTATLTIKNLTDTDYATPAQGVTAPDGVPNRGREISAGIEWRF